MDMWNALRLNRTLWCGLGTFAKGAKIICIASGYLGYRTMFGEGQPWLAYVDPTTMTFDTAGSAIPIRLETEAPKALDAFHFELRVAAVKSKGVEVRATAMQEGQESVFYSAILYFDPLGVARLPFWDRTLELTRVGKGVTARFQPRTDGLGWYDLGDGPASGKP